MSWTQEVTPNLDPYMYDDNGNLLYDWLGWCANYVRTAFKVNKKIPRAWWVWQQSPSQHADRSFPVGVYFPLYFRYTAKLDNSGDNEWGHTVIAYVYPDGSMKIWSSPISRKPSADAWTSIAQVEAKYHSSYVGWSEHVNGTRVILLDTPTQPQPTSQGENQMGMSNDFVTKMYQYVAGRNPSSDEVAAQAAHGTPASLLQGFIDNKDLATVNLGATIAQLNNTVSSLTAEDNAVKQQLSDAQAADSSDKDSLKTAQQQVADLTAQLAALQAKEPVTSKPVVVDPTYFSISDLFKAIITKVTRR